MDLLNQEMSEEALIKEFQSRDLNNDGALDINEIKCILCEIFQADIVKEENIRSFLKRFDRDADDKVTMEEFLGTLLRK